MKRIIFTAAAIFSLACADAQITKDSLLSAISSDVCTTLSKKDFTGKSDKDIQVEMGMAMLPTIQRYEDDIKAIYHTDISDPEGMQKLGMDVSVKLMSICPDFLKVMMKTSIVNGADEPKTDQHISTQKLLSGTLVKVVNGDFTYFQVKDSKGQLQKIWWMEYFDGADKLNDKLNKPVTIGYREKEVYSAALKDYVKIKVAASLK